MPFRRCHKTHNNKNYKYKKNSTDIPKTTCNKARQSRVFKNLRHSASGKISTLLTFELLLIIGSGLLMNTLGSSSRAPFRNTFFKSALKVTPKIESWPKLYLHSLRGAASTCAWLREKKYGLHRRSRGSTASGSEQEHDRSSIPGGRKKKRKKGLAWLFHIIKFRNTVSTIITSLHSSKF